jgi:proteasome lid subunit RPN8/RPN11
LPRQYGPLKRVTLSDEVGRTLFEEYAAHRQGPRGHEETGWVLLGLREANEAVVLATLPAGAERNAGVAHVRFNSVGQALGSRIVRQADRRLTMLGIVHTHPGSLRHPSDGDFQGDSQWVGRLRGQEGVFGIGTADGKGKGDDVFLRYLKPHVQCLGPLCLSWYSLREGDANYRPLPCDLTLGPDLARPLHSVWPTVEAHAERLDRLYCQQAGVKFEVTAGQQNLALAIDVPLAEPGHAIRVLLEGKEVRYYLVRNGEVLEADSREQLVDRGVYLLLAELVAQL